MGFTFNNIHSDTYNIAASISSRPLIPEKRQFSEYVLGRDGKIQVEDGYNNTEIEIECQLGDYDRSEISNTVRLISAWLRSPIPGVLELDDEPGMLYTVVSVPNNALISRDGWIDTFSLTFMCLPYQHKNNKTPVVTLTGVDNITLINDGTYKSLPVITLSGTADSITIGPFTYTNLSGTVYIDCINYLVYSLSGETKVNEISNFSGDFIELDPGTTNLEVTGTITSVDVTVNYWDTYL